jgi:hypothetical protein
MRHPAQWGVLETPTSENISEQEQRMKIRLKPAALIGVLALGGLAAAGVAYASEGDGGPCGARGALTAAVGPTSGPAADAGKQEPGDGPLCVPAVPAVPAK